MITWLIGENSFEVREALKGIERQFDGSAELFDASELTLTQLPDLLMGMSLFSTERLVVIRDITTNAQLWEKLPDWLPRVSDQIQLVFIDAKPDKRTTSYKALKAAANIQEFPAWTERDIAKATHWVLQRADQIGVKMDRSSANTLVQRVGVDQWALANALDTLSLLETVNDKVINEVIPANPQENIFQLFETVLTGDAQQAVHQLRVLELQEDPYGLFALLSSQAVSLAGVTFADDADNPAKDLGIHPFVASKLTLHGKQLGKARVAAILDSFAKVDADMKRSKADPWLLIEKSLLEINQIVR